MNRMPETEIERTIDEALAAMVEGEPRRVSGASVRRAMGESRGSRFPVWLAAAAVLVMAIGVALKGVAPPPPAPIVTRSTAVRAPLEVRLGPSPGPDLPTRITGESPAGSRRLRVRTTNDPPYEGLPRLTIASIDLPEPLFTLGLGADPIQISLLEIAPLPVSSLSNEQEN
jgi:hypothetical protein